MHQLKKWAAGGGLVALTACWPLAVGQIAQNILSDGTQLLNNDQVKTELASYERGYFSSQAVTRVEVIDPELKAQLEADGVATQFVINHEISHGLLSIDATSRLADKDINIVLETKTKLNGDTDFVMQGEPVSLEDASGGSISFSEYQVQGSASLAGEVSIDFSLPAMDIAFANGEDFVLKNLALSGEGQKIKGFWLGEQALSIEKVSLKGPQGESFGLNKLSYRVAADQNQELGTLSTSQTIALDGLVLPSSEFERIEASMSLNELDFEAFTSLMALYQQNPNMGQEQVSQAVPMIDQLVVKGVKVNLDKLHISTKQGTLDGAIQLQLPQGLENFSLNPTAAMNQIQGQLDATTSDALLNSSPDLKQMVDELIIHELVTIDGDNYRLHGDINAGTIEFEGGKQLPLWMLAMPFMMPQ
ncbi:DUF945 family protein [Vibrio sp. SCSIO 43136]|uniref:DUF945 family protein n=1 Tax=Vibrio sp. SCSIO 43136 TaxID=2819101 RepID=UPI0020765322|nr:DUF945 family protein [Vibrio sp. SCSIO 43136]USD64146.1 DUF945 family protein [Vibrio sp. SCSIO 43136]